MSAAETLTNKIVAGFFLVILGIMCFFGIWLLSLSMDGYTKL